MRRVVSETGKPSVTEYQTLAQNSHAAAVLVTLHTGRTHQIRVHFAAIHCPLLGDELYGGAMDLGIDRQALHCCELAFTHPFSGKSLHFKADLPADMASIKQAMSE